MDGWATLQLHLIKPFPPFTVSQSHSFHCSDFSQKSKSSLSSEFDRERKWTKQRPRCWSRNPSSELMCSSPAILSLRRCSTLFTTLWSRMGLRFSSVAIPLETVLTIIMLSPRPITYGNASSISCSIYSLLRIGYVFIGFWLWLPGKVRGSSREGMQVARYNCCRCS